MLLVISLTLPPAFAPAPRVSPKRGPALALRVSIPTLLDPEATRDASDGYVGVAAALAEAQAATLSRVVADLNLHPRESFEVGVGAGTASVSSFTNQPLIVHEGLEAARLIANAEENAMAGTKFPVAWLSALGVPGDADCLYTLTAWNLPSVSVPHLYTSISVTGGALELCIDFRPRAEAGHTPIPKPRPKTRRPDPNPKSELNPKPGPSPNPDPDPGA